MPPAKAADYVEQIAEAIHYAHERGVLHRDLKPSNVLIDSATDRPRVTDFGLAKRLDGDSSLTLSGQVLGSPNFMPPEQAGVARGKVGRPSDVYALGGILYYLLTARAPFQADSLEHTLGQVLHADPVAPRLLDLSIPRDLETIALKCLEKDPSRRYQTAKELAEELHRFLHHEPIRARPITAPEKLWRWSRRKPALASLIVLLHLVGAAGLGGIFWQLRQSHHLLHVARMNLAQAAWEQNNVSRAKQLLEETATAPERGFEWLYWRRQMHRELKALRGHTGPILAVAYSPDGRSIVTGGEDHRAMVWDAGSGHLLRRFPGHAAPVLSVDFFPDGHRILTAGDDQAARVWDLASGEETRLFKGHGSLIGSAACSPDGRRIVTGGGGVRFAPNGLFFGTTAGDDQTAKVWDAEGNGEPRTLHGHTDAVVSLDFSSDGRLLLSGSFDGTARLWDLEGGGEERVVGRHARQVRAVAFLPGDRRVVTGGFDRVARVWDLANGSLVRELQGHTDAVYSVAASPDGRWLATGSWDGTVKLWHAATGRLSLTFNRHSAQVFPVAFSPDSRWIASGSGDGMLRVWEATSGKERLVSRDAAKIWSAAYSKDGRLIVIGTDGLTATVRDAARGGECLSLKGHAAQVHSAAFSPDGARIVTGSADRTAKLWDTATGEELLTLNGHTRSVIAVAFSPDAQRIATGSADDTIRIWEAATEDQVARWRKEERLTPAGAVPKPGG